MNLPAVALELAAATVLLLYAVSLVKKGVEAAAGDIVARTVGGAGGRPRAAACGCAVAIALQSSTAVAMLAAGFAVSGALALDIGLAVLLGADLGSALVVKILSFDLHWLAPLLIAAGGLVHLKASTRKTVEAGRAVLGIGLLLLSLQMIGHATQPLAQSPLLPSVVAFVGRDALTVMILAALFTWALHSSVAAILLILTFAAKGIVPVEIGIPLVLGVNVGGGLIALWLTRGLPVEGRRLPLGNLLFRALFGAAVFGLFSLHAPFAWLPGETAAAKLVNLHVLFNAALVLVGTVSCGPMARLVRLLMPDAAGKGDHSVHVSALDRTLIDKPPQALAAAAREVLHMGDLIARMLEPVMTVIHAPTPEAVKALLSIDGNIHRAHSEIKLYIAAVNRGILTEDQSRRGIELTEAAIHLEYAGDVVAKSLLQMAEERLEGAGAFSLEGWRELTLLHAAVASNVRLAANLLVSPDPVIAREMVRQKEHVRRLVEESSKSHLERLRQGVAASILSSDMHLEIVRALKEVNSLVTTMAYPRLRENGDLLESRLVPAA
ncbi:MULTISPECIES: Na/Pi cotransporter family protein [unclassified Ensifer]|uniref:Na/Pi cotransporter family protein n=1 Tax=unclassified Ensifer TaxID=2633371 RepID=UPI0008133A56|nr:MULTISPECIES: Na/Pi cotransporter family protein [unclassified Ensifer]OCO99086.1 Na+ cotransporter [Ensifer sp. LC11]OCO99287.1 Na+ cotransporter [Ensifer sp. LC13]OCP12962.1 Na+ cotransporter [Ensifer sp. LC14]OCP29674.1 Na+ cotransporter [Ensifer sp. LC499]